MKFPNNPIDIINVCEWENELTDKELKDLWDDMYADEVISELKESIID